MSASLVGSEMCIRDRRRKTLKAARHGWPLALQERRIARIADWRIVDWSLRVGDFATSDPLDAPF
eukprot:14085469-Alexandrium_andersonii.AAC.1